MPLTPAEEDEVRAIIYRHISAWYSHRRFVHDLDLEHDCAWAERACWVELEARFDLRLGDDIRIQYCTSFEAICEYIEYLLADLPPIGERRPPFKSIKHIRSVLACARRVS